MFNSTIVDVAIGLIFTFLTVSLAVSSILEAIASVMKWRSNTLLQGVKQLLNDPNLTGVALSIYNHALVNPRDAGTATHEGQLKNKPAYIVPLQFADALIQIGKITQDSPDKIKAAINSYFTDVQIRNFLLGSVDRTAGDISKMRVEIAGWFDNAMDRLGGEYKRRTQIWTFFIALLIAGSLNISSITIGKALWQQPMIAKSIAPTENFKTAVAQLQNMDVPLGWTQARFADLKTTNGLDAIAGWLITAVATLFGASFWFDALGRIIRLKGSGPSPDEKKSDLGAAA